MRERYLGPPVREVSAEIPGFRIEQGLRPEIIDQLVRRSKEPDILENCPDDAAGRFHDAEAVRAWLEKGRDAYVLTPRKNLAGIAWYGEKEYPLHPEGYGPEALPRHTFGIRLYEGYSRRGLAAPFMDVTLVDYMQTLYLKGLADRVNGVWLSVETDNEPAMKLYTGYGYVRTGTVNKDGINEHIMVLSNPKITEKIVGA